MKAEVDESEMVLHKLSGMPIITSDGHIAQAAVKELGFQPITGQASTTTNADFYKCYILPPIKYPDGESLASPCCCPRLIEERDLDNPMPNGDPLKSERQIDGRTDERCSHL